MTVKNSIELPDRVATFSIKPTDITALKDLDELKKYCVKTGISFSYLMIIGMDLVSKQIGVKSKKKGRK